MIDPDTVKVRMDNIRHRIKTCWDMAYVFMEGKDAHGLHDMGVEIQSLERSLEELKKIQE